AREALTLFDDAARKAGGIGAEDRHGVQRFFPCTTLSIGAVRIMPGRFRHAEEVANLAAVAKHDAKQAGTGVVLHGATAESAPDGLALARALQEVLAA
ncbi:MAG: diguanylate phosphodiesterase, partial [Comamonadaceae bacterium]